MFGENCFSWYDQWGDFLFLFLTSWFLYQCITTDFWSIVICIYRSKRYQNVHAGHWSSQWKIPFGVIWHWEIVFWLYEGSERISLLRAELYLACLWISHCILKDLITLQMSNVAFYCWSEPKWCLFSVAIHIISNILSASGSLTPKIAIYGT